ncbi:MAG: ABC transporter ATP-binding protein [Candidatus Heimdallarchaeota archaeon]|nr:ABC transporter ATP-binding protein [Candidatus Heimdallarchaeota archaeon]MCK4876382.1 ABC transporter ATP-binding protein [Candidatus Heimdallarchaeota archaeon]
MSIEIRNLSKTFNRKGKEIRALDDISLNIREGEFIGLLGPNGAGKTTLTKILTTLLLPTSGDAYIDGVSIHDDKKIRNMVGSVFGETGGRSLYYRLSIFDNLLFYSTLSGVKKTEAKKRINSLLNFFDLESKKNTLVMKLSTGMKAKVLLIRALIPFPKVLLLDEPTLGFDAESSEIARDLLMEFNRECGTTIVLTSHNFPEIDDLTSRLVLIDNGQIIQDCPPDIFKESVAQHYVHLVFSLPSFHYKSFEDLIHISAGAEILFFMEKDLDNFIFEVKIRPIKFTLNETISRLTVLILRAGGEIFQVAPHMPSLKESFLAFLAINKQKDDYTQSFDEMFSLPFQEEE